MSATITPPTPARLKAEQFLAQLTTHRASMSHHKWRTYDGGNAEGFTVDIPASTPEEKAVVKEVYDIVNNLRTTRATLENDDQLTIMGSPEVTMIPGGGPHLGDRVSFSATAEFLERVQEQVRGRGRVA